MAFLADLSTSIPNNSLHAPASDLGNWWNAAMAAVHTQREGVKSGMVPLNIAILEHTESNSALWAQTSCPFSRSTGRSSGLPTH